MDDLPAVLVVEDEAMIRISIMEALQEGGYVVFDAHNGASAIDQLAKVDQLRGLITDIRLGPGPDGWEIAHRARERFPALPVVYVTGDSASDWPANGVPMSVVLHKPFVNAELVAALANQAIAHPPPNSV